MADANIQLVIFDLGGVLIRLCDGWDHACRLAGVTPSKPLAGADMDRVIRLVHEEEVGALEPGTFYDMAGPLLGLTAAQTLAMSNAWLCGGYPGIDGLIDSVNDAGLQTACLSNTNDNHWRAMTDSGHRNGLPLDRLNHLFASHLVKDRKPNATIYQHVERATDTPAECILFFDDSAENIAAANAQGWHTCHVTDPQNPVEQMTLHLKRHNLI